MQAKRSFLAAAVMALGVACGGGGGGSPPLQPSYHPEIINLVNSFSFQLTGVNDGTGQLVYGWQNTGTKATIDRSSSIAAGTVTLTIKDSAGTVVFTGPLHGVSGSVTTTTAGVAGTWTIQTDFARATGTINYRVQML